MSETFWKSASMWLYWSQRPLTAASYASSAQEYLAYIKERIPEIKTMEISRGETALPEMVSNEREEFFAQIARGLSGLAFLNDDPSDKTFRPSSRCKSPFSSTFILRLADAVSRIFLRMSIGRSDGGTEIVGARADSLVDSQLLASLFELSIGYWHPVCGCVNRERFSSSLNQPLGEIRIGWLTYLSGVQVSDLRLADANIERINSGTIVRLAPLLPDVNDDAFIEKLRSLREVLREQGLLGQLPGTPGKRFR